MDEIVYRLTAIIDGGVIEWQSIVGVAQAAIDELKSQEDTINVLRAQIKRMQKQGGSTLT
jgi:hypothetical protein